MYYHKIYGPVVLEKGWVPAPRYLLRRDRILEMFKTIPQGNILEVGCGAGTISHELGKKGFHCDAVESSAKAVEIASYVNKDLPNVVIHKSIPAKKKQYDVFMSFEVLEHIEHDTKALKDWSGYVKKNGLLLLSVPAHMSKWGKSDIWAGHFRRYEKSELMQKIQNAGFEVVKIESYGYPLSNFIEPIRNYYYGRKLKAIKKEDEFAKAVRTGESGVSRSAENKVYPVFSKWPITWLMMFLLKLQNLFLNMDLGTGYLLLARKK